MSEVIRNVINGNPQNLIPGVLFLAVLLWVLVVIASLWSVAQSVNTVGSKIFFSLVIIFLPLLGVLIYCGACLPRADWGALEGFKTAFSPAARQTISRFQRLRSDSAVDPATRA